jgi:endonuclease/exonuclease/phosphatase family metal-dependent hydrolase
LANEGLDAKNMEINFTHGVTRPMISVVVGNTCFATIHAIANPTESISQVKDSLRVLANKYNSWILMGDFNSEPSDYTSEKPKPEKLNSVTIGGTESRPGLECKMIFSKKATQGPDGGRNRNFDFAFVSKNFSDDNFLPFSESGTKVSNTQQTTPGSHYLSDHNLIGVRLSLPE